MNCASGVRRRPVHPRTRGADAHGISRKCQVSGRAGPSPRTRVWGTTWETAKRTRRRVPPTQGSIVRDPIPAAGARAVTWADYRSASRTSRPILSTIRWRARVDSRSSRRTYSCSGSSSSIAARRSARSCAMSSRVAICPRGPSCHHTAPPQNRITVAMTAAALSQTCWERDTRPS